MPEHRDAPIDLGARIDLAERLDAALDREPASPSRAAALLSLPEADPMAAFVSLATEIRTALHRPVLSAAERARIHDRAVDIAEARGHLGLRRAWPQLAHHPALRPAMIGGAAAAVLAVVGVAALQRRGHGSSGVLQAA